MGGYSNEVQFSQKGGSYDVDLLSGGILEFLKGTDDRTYYEVTWDGEFVDTLPVASDENSDPSSN